MLLIGGLTCAGIIGVLVWFVHWGVAVMARPNWQRHANQILRRSRVAHSQVRKAIQSCPRHLRKTLAKAMGEADRLLARQQEIMKAAARIGRSLGRSDIRKLRNDLRIYSEKETREANPRVRSQYSHARQAVEAQIAHYNAVAERLRQMLEAMREIQGTLEAMQPRLARLAMYEVDTTTDVDVEASREVLEDLDLLIGELERLEAGGILLDMEQIEREVEQDAHRRVAEGQFELEEAILPPTESHT